MRNKIHCDKRSTESNSQTTVGIKCKLIQINLILKIRDYKFETLDHQV